MHSLLVSEFCYSSGTTGDLCPLSVCDCSICLHFTWFIVLFLPLQMTGVCFWLLFSTRLSCAIVYLVFYEWVFVCVCVGMCDVAMTVLCVPLYDRNRAFCCKYVRSISLLRLPSFFTDLFCSVCLQYSLPGFCLPSVLRSDPVGFLCLMFCFCFYLSVFPSRFCR